MNTETVNPATRSRLARVQERLVARGMSDFKVTLGPGPFTLQQVAEDTANAMEAYLNGESRPLEPLRDSGLEGPRSEYYREVRELLAHTRAKVNEARVARKLTVEELLRLTGRIPAEPRSTEANELSSFDPASSDPS